ncbi:MarR family transcriptional regulator [Solwaraspora sp. WMMD1047]|uniref:MarR family transcriptional regulator n=1 Tax=Solwaraspora sp. WMMD1047 TaxID=3016102 RepID=UPI002416DB51|nr:MarR family transcriptional regulator [Solwaraspora sp. WMMD1047]MDG4830350.1 MarR family transcriptional regulator [Solwaraspora sp. WMMD1047]
MTVSGADLGWELSTAIVLFHEAIARRLGLNAAEHKALGLIIRSGPLPTGALAPQLGVGLSTVTGIVDRLERAGYVRRGPDPADRRRVLVSADPSRIPDLTGVFADLSREMGAFMSRYDEREMAAVIDYIGNTIRVLKAQTARLTAQGGDDSAGLPARSTRDGG